MKILHISTGVNKIPLDRFGCPEGHMFFMSKSLAKMGHQVTILDRKYLPDVPSFEDIDGVKIVRLPVKWFSPDVVKKEGRFPSFCRWICSNLNAVLFMLKANAYLRKVGEFEAINTYVISTTFVLVILNKGLRGRIFYNHHNPFWPSQSGGILNRLLSLLRGFPLKRVKMIITQNDSSMTQLITRFKVPETKIASIPAGIDTSLFSPEIKLDDVKEKYRLNRVRVILFVGKIGRVKGIEYLVKAVDIIVNQPGYRDALFLLVGPYEEFEINEPGEYTARILNLIKSFKLEQNVRLTGTLPLDELTKLYLACDIFVLPSVVEQFPLVVIEAMAAGKPVVATKTLGALMQVTDGWNGFLVEIGDERELAEKIKYLLDNPEEAKQMGINARETAEQFDWSIVAQKYLAVYAA